MLIAENIENTEKEEDKCCILLNKLHIQAAVFFLREDMSVYDRQEHMKYCGIYILFVYHSHFFPMTLKIL